MIKRLLVAMLLSITAALQTAPAWAARSLVVTLYPHEDLLSIGDVKLHEDIVQPWLNEMRRISDHPIEVIIKRSVAGVSDINYQQMTPEQTLKAFTRAVGGQYQGQKALLLTRDDFGLNKAGVISLGLVNGLGSPYGIASLATYTALGHELGHTMGATHEAAELRYNPWRCETYVYPLRESYRANCYRYSDANRATILNYLNETLAQ